MREGRDRAEWRRMSALLSTMCNLQRDPKKRPKPFTAAEFDPYEDVQSGIRITADNIELLKPLAGK